MKTNQSGLTLTTLLIIILIFNLIAIPAILFYHNQVDKSEYTRAELLLTQISQSVKEWKFRHGYYPKDTSQGESPGIPNDFVKWPADVPFDSQFDYDHWRVENGYCYVQIAFWGKNKNRIYPLEQPLAQPGELKKFGDNLVLGIDSYLCRSN